MTEPPAPDRPAQSAGRFRRRIRAGLKWTALVLAVLLVAGFAFGAWSTRRPFPKIDGTLTVAGLDGPVDIVRDSHGIPHIYAGTAHDLFFAQGFVHAQDRFWQMDVWRHIGAGRLAEMFGEDQVDADAFLRTLGWSALADAELELLDVDDRAGLDAYAAGVNAYLADRSPAELGFEYSVLELINHGYDPEPWAPRHTLTWLKAMAWELRGNMDSEITRALLAADLDPDRLDALYPPYPPDHPTIVTGTGRVAAGPAPSLGTEPGIATALGRAWDGFALLDEWLDGGHDGIGSNSWVIGGSRTATGRPILANDPHLAIQMPSIWYQVGLHCAPTGPACPYEVAGFSFAGLPGVVIGHNARIAWGLTNLGPDVMDLFVERLDPDDPDRYEANGEWLDMDVRTETIRVAGGDPVELTVRTTRHGPIISGVYGGFDDFATEAGIELPEEFAIALRWTALEPGPTFSALLDINRAGTWDEFRAAAAQFVVPAQNLIYADVDGNIGYQAPGRIPIRAGSADGRLPVPGWTGEGDWTGYIPFAELPSVYNPPEDWIVTANNAVVGSSYPYLLTTDWNYGHRAARIVDLVAADAEVTLDDVAAWQFDSHNSNAGPLLDLIAGLDLAGTAADAAAVLAQWDRQNRQDSAGAALFAAFWRELLAATFHDEIPDESHHPGGGSRWFAVVDGLLAEPDHPWWDDTGTPATEDRDDVVAGAFFAAVEFMSAEYGDDPTRWEWGDLHGATFEHQTLGTSGIGLIENRFNRGPWPVGGGDDIVNATGWTATEGFHVDWVPSMRMIVDLADLTRSRTVHTTGQSGHPYHGHYQDLVELWAAGEYYPMLWERPDIDADAEGTLRLEPDAG